MNASKKTRSSSTPRYASTIARSFVRGVVKGAVLYAAVVGVCAIVASKTEDNADTE